MEDDERLAVGDSLYRRMALTEHDIERELSALRDLALPTLSVFASSAFSTCS